MSAEAWGYAAVQRHPEWKTNLRRNLSKESSTPMMVGQGVDLITGDQPEQVEDNTATAMAASPSAIGSTLMGIGTLAVLMVLVYKRSTSKAKKSGNTEEHLLS